MIDVASGVTAGAVERIESADGTTLALHRWEAREPRAVIFYIHGIQSHAGWLFETGPALSARGVTVYALDRRGSGRSGGPRGDVPSLAVLLEDYMKAGEIVGSRHSGLPITALGQSLGGSILAGLVVSGFRADALLFCAPALGQVRTRKSAEERAALLERRSSVALRRVALEDSDYTVLIPYLEFIVHDQLMLRNVTERAQAAFYGLELLYEREEASWPAVPIALARPRRDPIIALEVAEAFLKSKAEDRLMVAEFPVTEHYLEFSRARHAYWSWVAALATTTGWSDLS